MSRARLEGSKDVGLDRFGNRDLISVQGACGRCGGSLEYVAASVAGLAAALCLRVIAVRGAAARTCRLARIPDVDGSTQRT